MMIRAVAWPGPGRPGPARAHSPADTSVLNQDIDSLLNQQDVKSWEPGTQNMKEPNLLNRQGVKSVEIIKFTDFKRWAWCASVEAE